MALDMGKRKEIAAVFEKFLRDRVKTIRKLKIKDLNIDPFLFRLLSQELNLKDSRSIVTWLVHQRLERGIVTSLGTALQSAARIFSEPTGVEGADIMKTKAGKHHYLQVKSGPNTVPKDMAVRISELLQSAQRRNRGSVVLFGMCYGNPDQVSGIVKKYVKVDTIIGREFWKFISDDHHCIDQIYEIAGQVGETFRDAKGQSLAGILDAKIRELQDEFEKLYGKSGPTMWQNLLKHNS